MSFIGLLFNFKVNFDVNSYENYFLIIGNIIFLLVIGLAILSFYFTIKLIS